jgi:glutamate racemase
VLVLGCTHYPLIQESIEKVWHDLFGREVMMIDPGEEAARRMKVWMDRK